MGKRIVAVWIAFTVVVFTTIYLFTFQESLRLDLDRVAHIRETLSMVYDLENHLADAESSARGYLLTGEDGQMERHQGEVQEIARSFDELYLFTAGEPKTQHLLDALKPTIRQRQELFQKTFDLAREKGPESRELQTLAREGSKVQARIRKSLENLEAEQKKQLNPEWAREQHKTRIILWGLTGGTFASFTLLSLVLYLLNREISGRKKAEGQLVAYQEDLRSLASQLTLAEERERRRLAIDLHDRIGHALALANIKLGELQKTVPGKFPGFPIAELEKTGKLLEEAIRDTRSLTFKISSPILYELGLEAALESLTEQVQEEHGIAARFTSDGRPQPLDEDVRVLLFQAVGELLVNVVKHAQARSFTVSMGRDNGVLKLKVDDDGVGFRVAPMAIPRRGRGGFGLFSICERLRPFGGVLEVQSAPGTGTHVTLTVPLKDGALSLGAS